MGLPVASNCNILLADKKGNMVVVECTPILKKVRVAEAFVNGSIVCTVNSFTDVYKRQTESLAVFIPFRVQEIYHENGVYYGQNVISKNMIIANRRQLLNGNSFILGVSGAGKSFTAKEEMTNIILTDPNADIIIIDRCV